MSYNALKINDLFGLHTNHDPQYRLSINLDRCVALHNEIVTIGWEARGRNASDLGQSWFDFHGVEAAVVRNRLSPDLIAFLERAWEVGPDHSFFYYVAGLHYPNNMFSKYGEDDRFLTLYAANYIAEHPDGLM